MTNTLPTLAAITISSQKWEESVKAWKKYFDYEVLESGYLSEKLVRTWNAPKNIDSRIAVLAPKNGDKSVYIRIVENIHPKKYLPLRSFGWSAVELSVSDVNQLEVELMNSPFKIIGTPHDLSFSNGQLRAMQAQGPGDEIIILTEVKDNIENFDIPIATCKVDRPFVAILAARDLETSQKFFYDKLMVPKGKEIKTEIWSVSNAFHLSRDTLYTISAGKLTNSSLIEIDEYPEGAIRRPLVPGYLPPGVSHVSFLINNIEEIPLYWLTEPSTFSGLPYQNRRQVTFFGSSGELIELIESQ